jgi:hypothetical protein
MTVEMQIYDSVRDSLKESYNRQHVEGTVSRENINLLVYSNYKAIKYFMLKLCSMQIHI